MNLVYVVDKHNKPLMPTKRCGYIKWLLRDGKAVCINNKPFTIKLKYDSTHYVQDLTLGIDTGRENIGLGVSNDKGECVYLCEVITNNKMVTKRMQERKAHRMARRYHKRIRKQRRAIRDNVPMQKGNKDILRSKKECLSKKIFYPGMEDAITHKVIKGKEAKFNNRKRKDNWLTPSARNLVQIHIEAIKRVMEILPISKIAIERVSFDFQKLENEDIKKWEYSKGPLYGFKDYKAYVYEFQKGKCLLCDNPIKEYHHIVYKSKNGSNSVKNFVGLCDKCHEEVHNNSSYNDRLLELRKGLHKRNSISLLNSCMHIIIEECEKLLPTTITSGFETKVLRDVLGLKKTHCIDGYVISLCEKDTNTLSIDLPQVYTLKHFKKKSNNNIHKLNSRKYFYGDKCVAINRHKAFNQKEDSLEEYKNSFLDAHTLEEWSSHFKELIVEPAKRTYTYHKKGLILDFYCGDKVLYEKYNKIKGNTKKFVFIVSSLNTLENKLCYNNNKQNCLEKYCIKLNSRSLEYI